MRKFMQNWGCFGVVFRILKPLFDRKCRVLIRNRTNDPLLTSPAIFLWRRDCPPPPLAGCTPPQADSRVLSGLTTRLTLVSLVLSVFRACPAIFWRGLSFEGGCFCT